MVSGPDHLAAVAPIAIESRQRAWRAGVRWGLGHSSGVLLVGGVSLVLRELLRVDLLSSWAERLVGVMLIGIGIWGLRKALTQRVHVHEHTHNGRRHAHIHVHGVETAHPHLCGEAAPHRHNHTAFAVGTLHGLAGSSHFLGILPALAFPSAGQAIGYLIAYGTGAVLAMGMFSSAVGWLARGLELGGIRVYRVLLVGCSAVAMVVGAYWLLS